jgi:hypothetical protein
VLRSRLTLTLAALPLLAGGAALACFTAPPPDLPAETITRPTILGASAFPPEGTLLTELPPGGFVVPVEVGASGSFYYRVFVDYNAAGNPNPTYDPLIYASTQPLTADNGDGGIVTVPFPLSDGDFQPGDCPHRIEFFVAHQFDPSSVRTPESYGGDSIAWTYDPAGCLNYDAGDGAFPEDAPLDGLPIAPESGMDP